MVFFTCDSCGEALKKNQVEKHTFQCRSSSYSCIDCNATFTCYNYKDHTKCISEDQKYGGQNFVQKENKGEVKQSQWVEQVERAIANVRNKDVKNILERILGFSNIPRKETKFINFLQNSFRIRDRNLCVTAWNCIAEEARKMREKAEKEATLSNVDSSETIASKSVDDGVCKASENSETRNGVIDEKNEPETKSFKWKRAIKRTLRGVDGCEMKMKKLRRMVIQKYLDEGHAEESEEDLKKLFDAKLKSSGVVVDGKVVRLSC